jgi:FkbM family methyltransferase
MPAPKSFTGLVADKIASEVMVQLRRHAKRREIFRGIVVPVDDLIGERVMSTGAFESTHIDGALQLSESLQPSADERGIFVDVGANIGLYTIALSKLFQRCVAVEANPHTYQILLANLALKGLDNVTAMCVGASDHSAETNIYVPINGNLGWATLNADHHKVEVKPVPVTLKPLDDIVVLEPNERVALIKIDVEGHEMAVLQGAQRILQRDHPAVLFEVLNAAQGRACAELLESCGYRHFFTFKRGLPHAGSRLSSILSAARYGLPVNITEISANELHKAALICARA